MKRLKGDEKMLLFYLVMIHCLYLRAVQTLTSRNYSFAPSLKSLTLWNTPDLSQNQTDPMQMCGLDFLYNHFFCYYSRILWNKWWSALNEGEGVSCCLLWTSVCYSLPKSCSLSGEKKQLASPCVLKDACGCLNPPKVNSGSYHSWTWGFGLYEKRGENI